MKDQRKMSMNEQERLLKNHFIEECDRMASYWRECASDVSLDVWVVRTTYERIPTYFTGRADGTMEMRPLKARQLDESQARAMAKREATDECGNVIPLEAVRLHDVFTELAQTQERQARTLRMQLTAE